MNKVDFIHQYRSNARHVELAQEGDEDLGALKLLPGTWKNEDGFEGRGWNMIALPFASEGPLDYRVLVNQYNEELKFTLVDKGVPNRGIERGSPSVNTDQLIVTLDYEQMIKQIAADDRPESDLEGGPDLAIHHEPGLFLNMTNLTTGDIEVARLATVPHGNVALALGNVRVIDGPPTIPAVNGLPVGAPQDLDHPYLSPYKFFADNPFKGVIEDAGFPGFDPVAPNGLLNFLPPNVARTTILDFDTTREKAGIHNIPFIERQADATAMRSTFWIMEIADSDELILAYSQIVMLDFFGRRDGFPGLIRWPHVSINMMKKVAAPDRTKAEMPAV
ncbi:heme-binding protein [Jannaschia sp. S6380]|uniref:heme-binding protein n=1 Tax=Jannaschia sp. S6380 TaxID=2926408 RepID=UPI001FF56AB7|nr:heme-binding protein [Jannaschia sp. S6380]MCK0168308.1 heme-binding protein [Jannaschia sp. S6380]